MTKQFLDFWHRATTDTWPYPYQMRFACSATAVHLLRAPTGAGKTAAAVLGWLWRWQQKLPDTPRRLVYCLPMRVLVEQSVRETQKWLTNLGLNGNIKVHVLMGGVDSEKWFLDPHEPAIIIGTQDMLLSRALNRGYGENRFHWPIDFGLLNNDCLWVFDEPQLMGPGVSTSAQLAGLRQALGTLGNCPSVWMSATLEPEWLDTIDFRGKFTEPPLELSDDDYSPKLPLHKRMTADKTLFRLEVATKDTKELARAILGDKKSKGLHEPGTQTLVIVNTVDRAKALYEAILRERKKSEAPNILLIHSRFRPFEREKLNEQLQSKDCSSDRIIVATQVVEAGVDLSARTLITELCPWSSAVQRAGRCNRTGQDGPGSVYWIDLDEKLAAPYEPTQLDFARDKLSELDGNNISPKALADFKAAAGFSLPFEHKHVLRRRDLLDLFDTAPDLSGNDIDIARFVRGDDPDIDLQVFWRDLSQDAPSVDLAMPERHELCSISVVKFKEFLKESQPLAYRFDHLDEAWTRVRESDVRPGILVLLSTESGGYDWDDQLQTGKGWDPKFSSPVVPRPPEIKVRGESAGSEPLSEIGRALTIAEHTEHVCQMLNEMRKPITFLNGVGQVLDDAARWHDVGKALKVCQQAMHRNSDPPADRLLAKSGHTGRLNYGAYGRRHFRHELGSALAVLKVKPEWPFIVAYLIAAHHGRVRLSIRSLPNEDMPTDVNQRFALGIHEGDLLPSVELGGVECPSLEVDLQPMQLGGCTSWMSRALALLTERGPFSLGYLEALLRAADMRASQEEAKNA